jgi:hypothetical protein
VEVTIKIPPEIVARAKAHGKSLNAYVLEILAQQPSPARNSVLRTDAEIRSWLDSLAQFSDKIPPLPDVISRAWLYED